MNAGPADTRSPHLDLGDLIAEVTSQGVDDQAREHLARCQYCRAEANRWDLVARGVRGLAAATPEAPQPARPRHTRSRVGPRRRAVLAVGVAAALVLLGVVGYGASNFVHITFGTAGTGTGTVLTAVGGCAGLEEASGTLEQVNSGSLVIKTASGRPVTVTTTASTFLAMSGPLLSDITDGASVTVGGPSSDGTIAAFFVTMGNPAQHHPQVAPGIVVAKGTVSDASTAGFTVITSGGTRVPVTTSSNTVVNVSNVSLDQLPTGARTFALGHAGPAGTLLARAVAVIQQLPQGNPQVNVQVHAHVKNCSPASIAAGLFGG
jgi:hypothetical protein